MNYYCKSKYVYCNYEGRHNLKMWLILHLGTNTERQSLTERQRNCALFALYECVFAFNVQNVIFKHCAHLSHI